MIIEKMCNELSLPPAYVARLVRTASYQYKQYQIPKKTGGTRTILHPSKRLKALQRWLLANVIASWPVHPAASAYRKGGTILDNAKVHAKSKYLLRMDLQDFFPSLKMQDLREYAKQRSGLFTNWTSEDFESFGRLIFREGQLTIGAPTSPAVSNALCFDLDVAMNALCQSRGVAYTRYADDFFFSSTEKGVLAKVQTEIEALVAASALPKGLKINKTKTRHSSKRKARRVTGIVLGSDDLAHVSRQTKRHVRSQVHHLDTLTPKQRVSLAGMISYITGFEPDFMNVLITKYGATQAIKARNGD
ncbi:MAG: retron St85 family RNA-directed DNA polymerase [Acidobacteriaceae bacterium]|nr:retron St85 family RNA-directed DNA polymerase [Acidobacteriaceae bacterium]